MKIEDKYQKALHDFPLSKSLVKAANVVSTRERMIQEYRSQLSEDDLHMIYHNERIYLWLHSDEHTFTIRDVAWEAHVGPNWLYHELGQQGYLYRNEKNRWRATQQAIDQGLFRNHNDSVGVTQTGKRFLLEHAPTWFDNSGRLFYNRKNRRGHKDPLLMARE